MTTSYDSSSPCPPSRPSLVLPRLQVLKNPALSRGGSQRTGLCTALHYAPFHLDWQADADREAAGALKIEEAAGPCVNMHGAGPCFCFPDTLIVS